MSFFQQTQGQVNPCYITVENEETGDFEKYQIHLDDDQFTVQPKFVESRNSIINFGDEIRRRSINFIEKGEGHIKEEQVGL